MTVLRKFSRKKFIGHCAGALLGAELGKANGWWLNSLAAQSDPVTERRREYLAILQRLLPRTRDWGPRYFGRVSATADSWEEWVEQTGELPPDFLNMPSQPFLPDPLMSTSGGGRVTTVEQWEEQKEWIRGQYQQWILGSFPPRPENLTATVERTWKSGDATVRDVTLRFGPEGRGRVRLEIVIPGGSGPFPTFLSQQGADRGGEWTILAVRRGYIACTFKVGDSWRWEEGDDSDALIDLYPEHDFAGQSRWAWSGMRAVDYLLTLPEVDPDRIAIGGNSRYAKTSLIAAAFDERISAVVPSRGNAGTAIPWRYADGMYSNQTLEEVSGQFRWWFHPRLRFFTGREDRLPVDQNMLLSLVAPRGLLLSHAYTEWQGNPWAIEQSYRSVKSVYEFLGAEEKLGLLQRPGEHAVRHFVIEEYLDFLDTVFGRSSDGRPEVFINNYMYGTLHPVTRDGSNPPPVANWESEASDGVPWSAVRTGIRERIEWILGEAPIVQAPQLRPDSLINYRPSDRQRSITYPNTLFERPIPIEDTGNVSLTYGDGLRADVYYAARPRAGGSKGTRSPRGYPSRRSVPTVIWLHPYAYAAGYSAHVGEPFNTFETLTKGGFNVVGVDLIGHGTRVEETRNFYERYPHHSILGRMVTDMSDLITSLSEVSIVDPDSIYVVGSGLGAKVALFLAALDERVRGVTSVCGFSSLRDRAAHEDTEGLTHYSHLHGLLPRLGAFVEQPEDVPFDYDDILAMIAPRPTLVIAPTLDRYHKVDSVRSLVERARTAFRMQGDEAGLELEIPEGFANFERSPARTSRVIQWLNTQAATHL